MASGSLSVIRSRCGGSSGVCTLSGTATASPDEGFQEALSCSSGSSSCAMVLLWVLSVIRQLDFAVIHTVIAMSDPMPKIQMNRPSDTGPSDPSVKPPTDTESCWKSSDEM